MLRTLLIMAILALYKKWKRFSLEKGDGEGSFTQRDMLELEVSELEKGDGEGSFTQRVECSLADAVERLNLAKMELAAKLREITSLKRQRDEVPTQAELIHYERRFVSLY